MALLPDLEHDCGSCAALCCLALAFDKGDMFAFDKPAGLPCPNLDACGDCLIYDELKPQGFAGCTVYSCNGAGQRVTQELFAGATWLNDPKLAAPMIDAFRVMRQVHDLIAMLMAAGNLPLEDDQQEELEDLLEELVPEDGWTTDTLAALEAGPLPARAQAFFRGLRDLV
ncbi:hypothetical protein [Actibacterium sp. XHP0104]|uniref:hypothetical protein n=1 Tax=Actibacterium sp. XHP0104 TaxID=2984335 RepID=UPI0021E80597|nr:hypothetical protein [Actibacterium sp. XHP0104]MCV2882284.1 hypothetical protein [Actibacterium sp. XHP0104]